MSAQRQEPLRTAGGSRDHDRAGGWTGFLCHLLVLTATFGLLLNQNFFFSDFFNAFHQKLECFLLLNRRLVDVIVLASEVLESERNLLFLFVSSFLQTDS